MPQALLIDYLFVLVFLLAGMAFAILPIAIAFFDNPPQPGPA